MPDVDIPNEVASQSFLNQSGALATTTIFTPTSAGLFRVAMYLDAPSGSSIPTVTISFNDPAIGSQTFQFPGNNTFGVGTANYGNLVIRVSANTNIQVSTNTNAAGTFNLYVTVEQL